MKFTLPNRFYVRTPTAELYELVQLRLFELGFSWTDGQEERELVYKERHAVANMCGNKCLGYAYREFYEQDGLPEVSISDLFLAEIPKKEVVIDILPWNVVIHADLVDVGCRKDIPIPFFRNLMKAIEEPTGISLDGYETQAGRRGFKADGQDVSWETWDKFVEAFNAATKE